MAKHIAILGISGCGKTEVTDTIAPILAAELNTTVGSAGQEFTIASNDEDLFVPGFHPWVLPWKATFSQWCKKRANQVGAYSRWQRLLRLLYLVFQNAAVRELAQKKSVDLFISDSNPIISFCADVQRCQGSDRKNELSVRELFSRVFYFLLVGGNCLPYVRKHFPHIDAMRRIIMIARRLGCQGPGLPDRVFFLDISPEVALQRKEPEASVAARMVTLERLVAERQNYLAALKVLQEYRGGAGSIHIISVDDLSPARVVGSIVSIVREHEVNGIATSRKNVGATTGRTSLSLSGLRWFLHSFFGKWSKGSWREPLFSFSDSGQRLLEQGYTPQVMRSIYNHTIGRDKLMDRVFHRYPLHLAMRERLSIISAVMEKIIKRRLAEYGEVRIFAGPAGYAYEVFKPLETLANNGVALRGRIHLHVADPDTGGAIEPEIADRARHLGVYLTFIKGESWSAPARKLIQNNGPYDIVQMIGSSYWLPKKQFISHLRWIHRYMEWDSILVADCLTPDAYSIAAYTNGFRANYYTPPLFRILLDYCGFDGNRAVVASGADHINHVVVTCPHYANERTCQNAREVFVAA